MAPPWTVDDIPSDLSGKTIFITGANSGIGFEASRVLASRKCNLILACRNPEKMATVAATFKEDGAAQVDELVLDTSDFESVRACATSALALPGTIDVLLLNAGTANGSIKACMTANHLGHFLLTGLLFSKLADNARIIAVSSVAHDISKFIPWDKMTEDHDDMDAYAYSKLANLLFVEQLNRLLVATGSSVVAVGAHPGFTKTPILSKIDGGIQKRIQSIAMHYLGQPTAHGAWPLLMAATDPDITRDCYYAPSKDKLKFIKELAGPPKRNGKKGKAVKKKKAAKKCWEESEKLTEFEFIV